MPPSELPPGRTGPCGASAAVLGEEPASIMAKTGARNVLDLAMITVRDGYRQRGSEGLTMGYPGYLEPKRRAKGPWSSWPAGPS
jgi:hypothetical protein